MTLPLELGIFQVCVYSKCERDAAQQMVTTSEDPQYFLAFCEKHEQRVLRAKKALERGQVPEDLKGVDLQHLFVRPQGRGTKCKYLHWTAPTPKAPAAHPTLKMPKAPLLPKIPVACDEWEWEVRPGRWMTLEGKSVKLSSLPNPEFISACIEVSRVNYARVTNTTTWVKNLVPPDVLCIYDEDKLRVGHSEAAWKLSEFKQEATERGLL